MTPEERAMLTELADKIAKTPTPAHDPEADEFIRRNIGNRPDALYILTQTTLIQNLAIQHAQQEIEQLKQRIAEPEPAQSRSSFLGGTPAPPRPAPVPGSSSWTSSASTPPPLPQSAPPSEAPSFLRSAAQTAAGVAAGAFAFEGIRALFGGGLGGWGGPHLGGFGGGSFLGGAPGGETIINNYYDNPDAPDRNASDRSDLDGSDADDANVASDDTSSDGTDSSADSEDADASYDDGAGSDDGGGYDDGGGSGGDDSV